MFRDTAPEDKKWINNFIKYHWGSPEVVIHDKIYYPSEIPEFIAELNSEKIGLVITNDSINAIYFYQKLGFRLVKINFDSVQKSRMIKPKIPFRVDNGILVKDELEFSQQLRAS